MYKIYKLHMDCTLDFAAEELKKYLRMMMPDAGEISIHYDPEARDGFRLGLLEDFGLGFEGKDPKLDDVIHIQTDGNGGILAGANPRSVLFAVYRYLKCNGCRFLFPGEDGEYIPMKPVEPVSYHKLPDYRYRAHTTEGDPSFEDVLRYIDYHAKQEMNAYALYAIFPYHRRYYLHRYNEENRPPEPVSHELVRQWHARCEAELTKRGMLIWGGGHGWTDKAAGFDPKDRFLYKTGEKQLTDEIRQNLALIKGKRDLYHGDPCYTNICLSREDLRTKIAQDVADYAQKNAHMEQVAFYLADNRNNHCECPRCVEKTPSDFYIMILNEIDTLLTQRGLDTKIQLIAYNDLMFAPTTERLNNPDRFILKATSNTRDYTTSINGETVYPEPQKYVRNGWKRPKSTEEYFALFRQWQAVVPSDCISYEYHYWVHQFRDPGMLAMSRRVYEDVRSWRLLKLQGCVQDGSNKSFFPNGFMDHIYGATLLDRELDYDKALQDYFLHCYGPDWPLVKEYLENVSRVFDLGYMSGFKSVDRKVSDLYDPDRAEAFSRIKDTTAGMREVIQAHMQMPTRPQNVCWRLLLRHTQWVDGMADAFSIKCTGDTPGAVQRWEEFLKEMGKHDYETERYFDFGLAANSLHAILNKRPKIEF